MILSELISILTDIQSVYGGDVIVGLEDDAHFFNPLNKTEPAILVGDKQFAYSLSELSSIDTDYCSDNDIVDAVLCGRVDAVVLSL